MKIWTSQRIFTISYVKLIKEFPWLKKLWNTLPEQLLLTSYKTFVRPHTDYGDIIYDELSNELFYEKLESVQYKSLLAITGDIHQGKNSLYN